MPRSEGLIVPFFDVCPNKENLRYRLPTINADIAGYLFAETELKDIDPVYTTEFEILLIKYRKTIKENKILSHVRRPHNQSLHAW